MSRYVIEYLLFVCAIAFFVAALILVCIAYADKKYRDFMREANSDIWQKERYSLQPGEVKQYLPAEFYYGGTIREIQIVRKSTVKSPARLAGEERERRIQRMKVSLIKCQE